MQVLDRHPSVLESVVVGMPDKRWGEVPVAYVQLRPRESVTADELLMFVQAHLPRFKVPKRIEFIDLPKTSTGKIQKNLSRRQT